MDPTTKKGAGDSSSTQPAPETSTQTAQAATQRQNLVDLAVKFLSNPRVMERSVDEKRAFLRKKGGRVFYWFQHHKLLLWYLSPCKV